MKKGILIKSMIAILVMVVTANHTYSQCVYLDKSGVKIEEGFEEDVKDEVISAAEALLNRYCEVSKFALPSDFSAFGYLFADDVKIFNDIEEKPFDLNIYALDYLDMIRTSDLALSGVRHELKNARLKAVKYSVEYQYLVNIEVDKVIYNQLNVAGSPITTQQTYPLKISIEINPDDLEESVIYELQGTRKTEEKSIVNTTSLTNRIRDKRLTFALAAGVGSIVNSDPRTLDLASASSSVTSYGFDLGYMISLDKFDKTYLSFGLRAEAMNVTSDLSQYSFANTDLADGLIVDESIGYAQVDFSSPISTGQTSQVQIFPFAFEDGNEELLLYNFQPKLGIKYNVMSSRVNRLLPSFDIVGNYSVSRSEGNVTGKVSGLKLPVTDLPFPAMIDQLQAAGVLRDVETLSLEDILVNEYKGEVNINNTTTTNQSDIATNSNFSLGVQLGLEYQRLNNNNFGYTFGVSFYQGITSTFDNREIGTPLLSGSNINSRQSSVLEDYFGTNRMSRIGLTAGVVYRFSK